MYVSNFGPYRFMLTNLEGRAIITQVNPGKKDELPIGTEVISVNGMTTKAYIAQHVQPYIASSTQHILEDLSISNMLEGYVGTSYTVVFKLPTGETKTLELTHSKTAEKELYPPAKTGLFEFKWVADGIAYVALNSFADNAIVSHFESKLPEIKKAKQLIVDVRRNSGGNTGIALEILSYITNDNLLYGSKSKSRLHVPAFKAWGKWANAKDTTNTWSRQAYLSYRDAFYHDFPYEPSYSRSERKSRIEIPTALLIGHATGSAAEDFLVLADNQKHMVKIGEPTFGSTGQPYEFDLPRGGSARVCTKKDTYPNGKEFVGYGVQPDIRVPKTVADYLQDKDPVLEKAIAYLQTQAANR